jgi:hypothetical protein
MPRLLPVCRLLASVLLVAAMADASIAEAQDCRDDRGEPAACPAPAAVSTPITATVSVIEPPAAPPEEERDVAYFAFELFFDVARPSGLPFTQAGVERAPELARPAVIASAPEVVLGGLSVVLGARPFPWLRIPEVRFSFGGGDYEGESASWRDGDQQMDATLGSVFLVRAELAGGFELPIDDFAIYAMGHVAIAGYFMEARLGHPSAGDLGVQTLAEDAWELGWTVGISGHIGDGIRLNAAYRHVHTGMESSQVRFGIEVTPSE